MQINRLFEIIYILLDKKTVTADKLAERFEVSRRTIYRDIELLSQSGIPLYTNRGKGGGISLLDNFVLDKTLISDKEQSDILSALVAMSVLPNMEKTELAKRLSALFRKDRDLWISVDFSGWNTDQKLVFDTLKKAVIEKYVIETEYINSCGQISKRLIEPLQLWFKSRTWYLIAYCRKAEDYRIFRLSRMKNTTICGERFERVISDYKYEEADVRSTEITMLIKPEMKYRVYDEFESFENDGKGNFVVKMNYPEDEWLYGYIMSFGKYAEVLKPVNVRNIIKKRFEDCLKNYL